MSIGAVFASYDRIAQHLEEAEFKIAYSRTLERLNNARELYVKWLDLYKEYAKGYSQELLKLTSIPVIRMLSFNGVVLEERFSRIRDSKIPSEVYLLIDDMFSNLDHPYVNFIIVQGDLFEKSSIYDEVKKATTSLSSPGAEQTRSAIDVIKTTIRTGDMLLLNYERSQYDNPFSWPLLLHEGFHHIYHDEQLDRLEKECPDVPWVQEALIDVYLMHFFGPAYAASTAIYLMRFPHIDALSYPHFIARLFSSLLYLTNLVDGNAKLPVGFKEHVTQTFKYVEKVWDQYRRQEGVVQKEVEDIYNAVEDNLRKTISSKTSTFSDLLLKSQDDRLKAFKMPDEEYVAREVMSVEDVLEFYGKGIPIAANPRILFNSFIASRFLVQGINLNFVRESLKKWYMKKIWSEVVAGLK